MKWNLFFSVGLNEVDLTKLNILSQDELIGIVEWNICLYEEIIKHRLSCKMCKLYDVTEFGDISKSTPFQCLHCFHPLCVTDWNNHGLMIRNSAGYLNECFIFPINILICMIMTWIWIEP